MANFLSNNVGWFIPLGLAIVFGAGIIFNRVRTHDSWIGEIRTDVKNIFAKLDEMGNTLSGLKVPTTPTVLVPGNPSAKSLSPWTLTQEGIRQAEAFGAAELVEKYYHRIIVPEDANKMYIQNAALNFCNAQFGQILTQEERDKLDDVLFEEGGDGSIVISIFSVLFRNRIFQDKGFDVPPFEDVE